MTYGDCHKWFSLFMAYKGVSSVIATPDLSEMRCKYYYKILSGNGITKPTGIKKWENISLTISQIGEKSLLLNINPQRIINQDNSHSGYCTG